MTDHVIVSQLFDSGYLNFQNMCLKQLTSNTVKEIYTYIIKNIHSYICCITRTCLTCCLARVEPSNIQVIKGIIHVYREMQPIYKLNYETNHKI